MKYFFLILFFVLSSCKKESEGIQLRCWKFSYQFCLYDNATGQKISCGTVMQQKGLGYTKEEVLVNVPDDEVANGQTYKFELLSMEDYDVSDC